MPRFDYERCRAERERQSISREQLAADAGLSYGLIVKVEHGDVTPSVRTICLLADVLGMPVGEMFHDPRVLA